ncbi:hypothetical protein [Photobacterium sanguinicancri]|uniref:hypothetical protein n=1 Tax=Photobacterium sanguinicancri TaxID=875932 RepID=UPI000787F9C6|nr:hypothetical protein [Photobacterium sanguinicancri]KXI21643.1 hypothetical protein AS132_19255 [Photobacterium sanguinicancri]
MSKNDVDLTMDKSKVIEELLLRNKISPLDSGIEYKILHQLDCVREALTYRYFELINSSYELYKSEKFISGLCLSRTALETLSVLLFINIKLNKFVNGKDVVALFNFVEKLMVGYSSKNTNTSVKVESINVMKFIKEVDKKKDNFLSLYDTLSEYSHPNYLGSTEAYSHLASTDMSVFFSKSYKTSNVDLSEKLGTTIKSLVGIHWLEAQKPYGDLYEQSLDVFIGKNAAGNLRSELDFLFQKHENNNC